MMPASRTTLSPVLFKQSTISRSCEQKELFGGQSRITLLTPPPIPVETPTLERVKGAWQPTLNHLGGHVCTGLDEQLGHLPRAGWVSLLLLEWLRNAVQPPGSRTSPRACRILRPRGGQSYRRS